MCQVHLFSLISSGNSTIFAKPSALSPNFSEGNSKISSKSRNCWITFRKIYLPIIFGIDKIKIEEHFKEEFGLFDKEDEISKETFINTNKNQEKDESEQKTP